ncbi:MAG: large-conductance mechanosensitive channel protein MscL [Muribaculaceae bacterium]
MKSKFLADFKAFAMRGNVIDMAVGVIIGGAFGKIVSSLVNDIIMPLIGIVVGGVNFTDLKWVITPASVDEAGNEIAESTLNYGTFIQTTIDFLIIAFSIFVMVRVINKITTRKKAEEEAAPAPAPEPSNEEKLLAEIRDLLKEKK